jgi:hypothetical protein
VLHSFRRWLSQQPQHSAVKNYTWSALVVRELFEHGREDDLVYPTDDVLVIEHLFPRLREFVGSKAAVGSGG